MKKLMAILLTIIAIPTLVSCGTIADLTTTPNQIAEQNGVDAAVAWCDERDEVKGGLLGTAHLAGLVADAAAIPVNTPAIIITGKTALAGTTFARDAQCADLRAQRAADKGGGG